MNQKCPAPDWWGETSTEIQAAEDLHLEASLEATGIRSQETGVRRQENTPAYDLQGRRMNISPSSLLPPRSSIIIRNGKKFISK